MKKIIFEKYKLINLFLFVVLSSVFIFMNGTYNRWFENADIYYIYDVFDGIYNPVMVSAKWLAGILVILLLFPSKIFRTWLFFIAPPILLLTYILVRGISVYSSNIINPSRAQMAENGMFVLSIATAILIAIHFIRVWRKKKSA